MNALPRVFAAVCLLLPATLARAHQIPNITIEAMFAADHTYTLRVNLDPRVFLSAQPTSLPPVEAAWWLEQSAEEQKQTLQRARDYLGKNFQLSFSGQTSVMPECAFTALDGGTMEALTPDTAETHLLAVGKGRVPGGADAFELAFGSEANVSLILLNSQDGKPERRPQVLFPGESSRPYKISPAPAMSAATAAPAPPPAAAPDWKTPALSIAGPVFILLLVWRVAARRKWKTR